MEWQVQWARCRRCIPIPSRNQQGGGGLAEHAVLSLNQKGSGGLAEHAGFRTPLSARAGYLTPLSARTGYLTPLSARTGYLHDNFGMHCAAGCEV